MSTREFSIKNSNVLGLNMRLQRKLKSYTQDYMAEQLHMSRSTYSFLESGATNPRVEDIIACAKILACDFNTLFDPSITEKLENNIGLREFVADGRIFDKYRKQ